MSSPVKVDVDEEAFGPLRSEPKHGFYRALVEQVLPSRDIRPIESRQKPRKFPTWDKANVAIMDHLYDVKCVAEQHVLYGTMKHTMEYFHAVLASVSVDGMRDELRTFAKTVENDVSVLLYLLVRAHHNQYDEQNALTALEGLGVYGDVEEYNAVFDKLASRVTDEYLTVKARVREYVKHVDPRVNNAAHLSSRVDEGWSLIQVKNEALRVSRLPHIHGAFDNVSGANPPVAAPVRAFGTPPPAHAWPAPPANTVPVQLFHTPTPPPPPAPGADGDTEMQALNQRIEELELQFFNNQGGRGGRGRGRGARAGRAAPPGGRSSNRGRGRGDVGRNSERSVCFVCGAWDHFARECPNRAQ
jgi:hypothetical protein